MRTENVTTQALNYTIVYPDELVYRGDTNYIQIAAQRVASLDVEVTIGTYTLHYVATTDNITIDISDTLKVGGFLDRLPITVTVNNNAFTFTSYIVRGCTDGDRYHGSGRSIVLPNFVSVVELLMLSSNNTVRVGSATSTNNETGVRPFPVTWVGSGVAQVTVPLISLRYGDYFDPKPSGVQLFNIQRVECHPENGAAIQWYDHDGCKRYLVGKVLRRSETATYTEYAAGLTTIRSVAGAKVKDSRRLLTIGFTQVDKEVHLEEIMDSEEVLLLNPDTGAGLPILPAFTSLETSFSRSQDYVLQFIVKI